MPKFSANLGFLWKELPLLDAICAAKEAGFHAVECHWPYDTPTADVKAALEHADLQMLGLNTRLGDVQASEFGLSALPNKIDEARAAIDEAIGYASMVKAKNIHVMAGNITGEEAKNTFCSNLKYACAEAIHHDITILIEAINAHDVPKYFLRNQAQAIDIIKDVGAENLKLMFDCYHVGRTEGDVLSCLKTALPFIGHIQFAAVPDRGAPDHGDVDYPTLFTEIDALGWSTPLGAEYKPEGDTQASLGWMNV